MPISFVLQTETALAYDAYFLFAKGLYALSEAKDVTTSSISCDKVHPWENGLSLLNYMRTVSLCFLCKSFGKMVMPLLLCYWCYFFY